ncbi:hypothetical protein ACIBSV_36860 [Embleya sp. NPDC050154]|uniref:hypothetical protein n=1 Tax=unclassified Embleya TaxID=2699296 RepID=UPI0037B91EC3
MRSGSSQGHGVGEPSFTPAICVPLVSSHHPLEIRDMGTELARLRAEAPRRGTLRDGR